MNSSLTLRDDCPDKIPDVPGPPRFTDTFWLCGVLDQRALSKGLTEMPRLRSVTMYQRSDDPHGISWPALRAVMSLANVCEFTPDYLRFCPILRPGEDIVTDALSPLSLFTYIFGQLELASFIPASGRVAGRFRARPTYCRRSVRAYPQFVYRRY